MSTFVTLQPPENSQHLKEINLELAGYGVENYDFDFRKKYNKKTLPWAQLCSWQKDAICRLRTIAIELEYNPHWTPEEPSIFVDQPILNDLVQEVFGSKQSHFVYHWTWYGSYVPVQFPNINSPEKILSTLGSSINLVNELRELAYKLCFDITKCQPYFRSDYHIYFSEDFEQYTNDVLCNEKYVLLELYTMALASIEHNLMIRID